MNPSPNIWDTRWKVRRKLLQRNDCWNERVGYQRRAGTKANNDLKENQEQWNDPWSFLAFWSTPGKRVAHQLYWRISKQIVQLSQSFPASENATESCQMNISSLVSAVWGAPDGICPDLQGYMKARHIPGAQIFLSLTWTYILSQPSLLCRNGFESMISFAS